TGVFTYNVGGVPRTQNLLSLRGLSGVDPTIQGLINQTPGPDKINNIEKGDGLNTGGYRFNQRDNEIRDNVTGKIDFNFSTTHAVSGTYAHNRDNADRPD